MVLTNVHIEASKVTDVYVDSGCKSFTATGCRFGSSGSPPTRNIHLVHSTAVAVLSSCRFMGYNNGATKDGIKTHADAQLHLVGQNWIDGADFTIADIDNGSPNGTIVKYASFGPDQAVTGNGNLTVDFALGGNIQINLTGNTALQAPSNVIIGALYYIRFSQDGSGGHTVSFTAGWKNNASINTTADKKTGTLWVGIGQGVLAQIANLQEA